MKFTNNLVKFSYFISERRGYLKFKNLVDEILNNNDSTKKRYFDIFMIVLVLSTIGIFIYEIKDPVHPWMYYFEDFAIVIFILEWLGRLWVCSSIHDEIIDYHEKRHSLVMPIERRKLLKIIFAKKLKFIFSPLSIVDLLAILPYYRPLRILRIFLLFRLFKLVRYAHVINSLFVVFKDKRFELLVLVALSFFVILIASTVMYTIEGLGDNPHLNTFFDAVYWAVVTMATVGYGDIVPETTIGRVVAMILMAGGLLVVVLATSIITSAFAERLSLMREDRMRQDSKKLKNSIVILGYGRMGMSLASLLHKDKRKFLVVDNEEDKVKEARDLGYLAYKADVSDYDTLQEIVFSNNVSSVAVLTERDSINLSVLLGIKASGFDINVITRANEKSNIKKFQVAGADHVIFPHKYVAHSAVEYINSPVTFDALDSIIMEKGDIRMDKLEIPSGSSWIGKSLHNIKLSDFRITLIGVFTPENPTMIFKPNQKEYILKNNDKIVVIGLDEQIEALIHRLRKS